MKKKVIIIISLIAVLALGSTIAFAATEDGQLVNPFSRILGEKVEDGTITADEASVFSRVWDAIKGDREDGDLCRPGRMGPGSRGERPVFDEEVIAEARAVSEEIHTAVEVKTDEVLAKLMDEGYITQDAVDSFQDNPKELWRLVKDADEETQAALKAAMVEVKDYYQTLIQEKIESGELSEEAAGFLTGGKASFEGCDMNSFYGAKGRTPEYQKKTDDDN